MDRCHTVPDVYIQQMIVNYLNNGIPPKEFRNACVIICGIDIEGDVVQFLQDINQASTAQEKVAAANRLYVAIVNKHYNLRYGYPSSNRAIGGYLDLFFPKIKEGKAGDNRIKIKISPIDAEVIKALRLVGIEAKIKAQGKVVLCSDDPRTVGSQDRIYIYSLDITSIHPVPGKPFSYIYAEKMD